MDSWWLFFPVGFGAQFVDGTLGGVRCVVEHRAYGNWSSAGARQRVGSHRGNFHHLVMDLYILWKSTQIVVKARKPAGWMALLGFAGGFLDASGGGGGDQ
jgi:uncharacterized membrane protein YfcA